MATEQKSFEDKLNDWFEKHPEMAEKLIGWLEKHETSLKFIGGTIGAILGIIGVVACFKGAFYFVHFVINVLEPIIKRIW